MLLLTNSGALAVALPLLQPLQLGMQCQQVGLQLMCQQQLTEIFSLAPFPLEVQQVHQHNRTMTFYHLPPCRPIGTYTLVFCCNLQGGPSTQLPHQGALRTWHKTHTGGSHLHSPGWHRHHGLHGQACPSRTLLLKSLAHSQKT